MNFKKLLLVGVSAFVFVSCSNEDNSFSKADNYGVVELSLAADYEVTTRAIEHLPEHLCPNLDDFTIEITKDDGSLKKSYKYSDQSTNMRYPIGGYTMKAYYGDSKVEAFDKPYFEGTTKFTVRDTEITPVNLNVSVNSSKVSVSTTEAFNRIYKSFALTLRTGKENALVFDNEETRSAYIAPGTATAQIAVVKQDGKSLILPTQTLSNLQAKNAYNIRLNVNGGEVGGAIILISYDDATNDEPIAIDLNEVEFNSRPFFKTENFPENGSKIESVEREEVKQAPVSACLVAQGGIKSCILTTSSDFLLSKGWPTEIDLCNASVQELSLFKEMGLKLTGLGEKRDIMAFIDFTDLFKTLEYVNDGLHSFSISATDKEGVECKSPIELTIKSEPLYFNLQEIAPVVVNSRLVVIPVRTNGAATEVEVRYANDFGSITKCTQATTKHIEGDLYEITANVNAGDLERNIYVSYKNGYKMGETKLKVIPIEFAVTAEPLDAFAKRANITFSFNNPLLEKAILQDLKIQVKGIEGDWITPLQSLKGNIMEVQGLSPESLYSFRGVYRESNGRMIYSENEVNLNTEPLLSIPNADFELWHENKTNGAIWTKWFPWSNVDTATKGWATINEKTTSEGGTSGGFLGAGVTKALYVANSGTIPTSDKISGEKAALIRSVGWGKSNSVTILGASLNKTDAGYLYLGSYNSSTKAPNYGIPFTSRPSGFSFHYKYEPKNATDKYIAQMVVESASGEIIAMGEVPSNEAGEQLSYTKKDVLLNYTNSKEPAGKMYIVFISGTKLNKDQTDFTYPSTGEGVNGEFIGAKLWIDNVELIY